MSRTLQRLSPHLQILAPKLFQIDFLHSAVTPDVSPQLFPPLFLVFLFFPPAARHDGRLGDINGTQSDRRKTGWFQWCHHFCSPEYLSAGAVINLLVHFLPRYIFCGTNVPFWGGGNGYLFFDSIEMNVRWKRNNLLTRKISIWF